MTEQSPVTCDIDLTLDGKQSGQLAVPQSTNSAGWAKYFVPISVIRNGEGPTAVLFGGNHGDEYEGPIALFDLAQRLTLEEITGRVIILPAMNYPAFRAGTRTSPIDKGNLNRLFPGSPVGTPSQKIADYVQRNCMHWTASCQ